MGYETNKSIEANKNDPNSLTAVGNATNSSGTGKFPKNAERPIVLRKRRERVKSSGNWHLFYYMFTQDQAKPNLIWNYKVILIFFFFFGKFCLSWTKRSA